MINLVWLLLILAGVVVAGFEGNVQAITEQVATSTQLAIETVLGFMGIMVFWMGMSKIAEESGLIDQLSALIRPLFRPIFPDVPEKHPAMGAMMMNMSANLLGLGQAATPLGLKAMKELQDLNDEPDTASPAMITFLALNTSSITLVPATMIAFRADAGSINPSEIVITTLIATAASSAVALTVDYCYRRRRRRRS